MHIRSEIARKPAMQIAKLIAARANANAPVQGDTSREGKRRQAAPPAKGSYVAASAGNVKIAGNFRAAAVVYSRAVAAIALEGASHYKEKAPRPLLKAAMEVSVEELGRFDGHGS